MWTSAIIPSIMEGGIASLEGEVIDEYHWRPSSSSMYGSHPPVSFTSEMAIARKEFFACRLTSSGVSRRSCDICCTIGGHRCAWLNDVDGAGGGGSARVGSVSSGVGGRVLGVGVGISKADGGGVGHGGIEDEGGASAREVLVVSGGAGFTGVGGNGVDVDGADPRGSDGLGYDHGDEGTWFA